MRSSRVFGVYLGVVILSTRGVHADEATIKRVRGELPAAAARLAEAASHIHGSGIEVKKSGPASKPEQWTEKRTRYEFYFDGRSKRVDAYREWESYDAKHPYCRTWCCSPTSSFTAERATKDSKPILTGNAQGVDSNIENKIDFMFGRYVHSATYIDNGIDMADLLGRKTFTIADAVREDRGGLNVVRLTGSMAFRLANDATKKSHSMMITLYLSPEAGWIMREAHLGNEKSKSGDRVEYREMPGGGLAPSRVDVTGRAEATTFEFREYTPGPSPPGVFTYEGVGLPNLSEPAAKPPTSGRAAYYFAGLGGSALVVAAAIKAIEARRRRRPDRAELSAR